MVHIKEFAIVLAFSLAGELLAWVVPLPIPAAIYGLVLLLAALALGILKTEQVQHASSFLLGIMPMLFVAPAVNILSYWGLIAPNLVPICTIVVLSTLLVFAVAGLVTQALLKKEKDHG